MKRVWIFWGILGALILFGVLFPNGSDLAIYAFVFWIVFAFFHYRYVRQEEFVHFLTMAVASRAPLAQSVRVYLRDRPRDAWHEFWVALLVFPLYYALWHRQNSFDRKLTRVAEFLEEGMPLAKALRDTPGVAAPETILATAVGQATGKLEMCLRSAPRWRIATLWLDVLPRLIYPFLLLLVLTVIGGFLMIFIIPKFAMIFQDFHMKLPWLTEQIMFFSRTFFSYAIMLLVSTFILVSILLASSTCCWYCPVLGRFYRMHNQGRFLHMLGLLLEAGLTVPQALQLLDGSRYFGPVMRKRLQIVGRQVEQGGALAEGLNQQRLLPSNMVPLVQSAQRTNHLPWALAELGDMLGQRTFRLAQRWVMGVFPVLIVAGGVLIGTVVLGLFVPLIELLTELNR